MNVSHERVSSELNPDGKGYAKYGFVEMSVIDLLFWFNATGFRWYLVGSPETYVQELKFHNYFTAPLSEYTNGLKNWYS